MELAKSQKEKAERSPEKKKGVESMGLYHRDYVVDVSLRHLISLVGRFRTYNCVRTLKHLLYCFGLIRLDCLSSRLHQWLLQISNYHASLNI